MWKRTFFALVCFGGKEKRAFDPKERFQLNPEATDWPGVISASVFSQLQGNSPARASPPLCYPQPQRTERCASTSRSLAESPWLQHLMCSSYVIDLNKGFVYLACPSRSCTLSGAESTIQLVISAAELRPSGRCNLRPCRCFWAAGQERQATGLR